MTTCPATPGLAGSWWAPWVFWSCVWSSWLLSDILPQIGGLTHMRVWQVRRVFLSQVTTIILMLSGISVVCFQVSRHPQVSFCWEQMFPSNWSCFSSHLSVLEYGRTGWLTTDGASEDTSKASGLRVRGQRSWSIVSGLMMCNMFRSFYVSERMCTFILLICTYEYLFFFFSSLLHSFSSHELVWLFLFFLSLACLLFIACLSFILEQFAGAAA